MHWLKDEIISTDRYALNHSRKIRKFLPKQKYKTENLSESDLEAMGGGGPGRAPPRWLDCPRKSERLIGSRWVTH